MFIIFVLPTDGEVGSLNSGIHDPFYVYFLLFSALTHSLLPCIFIFINVELELVVFYVTLAPLR